MSRSTMMVGAMLLAVGLSACGTGKREALPPRPVVKSYTRTLGPGEFVRVGLEEAGHYRLELEGRGARVELKPMEPGMMRPLLHPYFGGASLSRTQVFDVTVRASGDYMLRVVDAGDAAFPVRVRLDAPGWQAGAGIGEPGK